MDVLDLEHAVERLADGIDSKHEPTRPMDWVTPSRRQARLKRRDWYSASSIGRCNTVLLQRA
ncbi:hypothetical protein [Streptomyces sp. NBC_00140]|uniref:hypothetical protein n=1 Tax=Streptomyces sp. NBC_00140 TaxID=2975664 RepID=UPI00225973F3|nr:hypothetical protein [Streptomyces sp. NBC_00140]MCX5336770.1 hypothetical protein [Streptomyces sp. NBC_00140]